MDGPDPSDPCFLEYHDGPNRVRQGYCPSCTRPIVLDDYTEEQRGEYSVMGLCKNCQWHQARTVREMMVNISYRKVNIVCKS